MKEAENIENKIRNKVSPFQLIADIIDELNKEEGHTDKVDDILFYLKKANMGELIKNNIDWLIRMGRTLDKYIDNKYFDIVELMDSYKEK